MAQRVRIPWETAHPFRYSITEWEIDPERTALLLMDFQAAYIRPDVGLGHWLAASDPAAHAYYYARLRETVLPNTLRLLSAFRRLNLPVIFTRLGTMLPDGAELSPATWRARLAHAGPNGSRGLYPIGSPEHELIAGLTREPNDLVVDRATFSPFNSWPLDQCLRNMQVENLAVCGVRTEAAPETTARDAGERGYNVFVVEDACATLTPAAHEEAIQSLSWCVPRGTAEVLALLEAISTAA